MSSDPPAVNRHNRGALSRVLREPLVHFLIIGGLLLGANALMNSGEADVPAENEILITAADVERLGSVWEEQWRRPPTPEELAGLIDDFVREEVLYREAMALGLDDNDTIIRRRLAQKFTFLTKDLALQVEPSDEDLETWYRENPERYQDDPTISFSHIYFGDEKRGDTVVDDAKAVLEELRADPEPPVTAPDRGDRFMLRYDFQNLTTEDINRQFGAGFGEALTQLEVGTWQGPVESGFGMHLVRVHEQTPASIPEFALVRDIVEGDWLAEQNRMIDEDVYKELLARYVVKYEPEARADLGMDEAEAQ
jgi:hypothetical protein